MTLQKTIINHPFELDRLSRLVEYTAGDEVRKYNKELNIKAQDKFISVFNNWHKNMMISGNESNSKIHLLFDSAYFHGNKSDYVLGFQEVDTFKKEIKRNNIESYFKIEISKDNPNTIKVTHNSIRDFAHKTNLEFDYTSQEKIKNLFKYIKK